METTEQLLMRRKAVEKNNGLSRFMLSEAIQKYYARHHCKPLHLFTFEDAGYSQEVTTLILTNNFHRRSLNVYARRDDILDAVDWVRKHNRHVNFESRRQWGKIQTNVSGNLTVSTLHFLVPIDTIPNFALAKI